jgi:multidrug resistance efflux pump
LIDNLFVGTFKRLNVRTFYRFKTNMKNSKSSGRSRLLIVAIAVVVIVAGIAAWQYFSPAAAVSGPLAASGTIEARVVNLSAELSARVIEVSSDEGQQVKAGQVLAKLDGTALQAQYDQVTAALQAAQANYDLLSAGATAEQLRQAQAALDAAQANYDLLAAGPTAEQVRQAEAAVVIATANYSRTVSGSRQTDIAAAQSVLQAATAAYEKVKAGPQREDYATAEANVKNAEAMLKQAQSVYDIAYSRNPAGIGASPAALALEQATNNYNAARSLYDKVSKSPDNAQISAAYQAVVSARAALERAQNPARDYDVAQVQAAVDQAQAALAALKAGARVQQLAAARAQVAAAQAQLDSLKAGARAQQLDAAQAQVAVAQAQVKAVEAQIKKLTIVAPLDGVILSRNVDPGELAAAGATLFEVGKLDALELTVYLPEERFARVTPGGQADVHVDAYPDRTFTATVLRIADQAEFTPRNVQTVEGRKDTVFAVRLSIANTDLALKPGMPADVTFAQ